MAQFSDQVLHTFKKFSKTFADSIHNGSPAMSALRRHGGIKRITLSGTNIVPTVLKDETNNITHFRGKQRIQHAAEEPLDGPQFKWHYMAYKGALAETDILENSGREQIIDRIDEQMKLGRIFMTDRLNKMLVKLKATNATDFGAAESELHLGFPDIIFVQSGGTTVGQNTLGGIDRSNSDNDWYRNQGSHLSTAANILAELNLLLMNCSRGSVRPSFWLSGIRGYNIIMDKLQAKFVINQPQSAKPIKFQAGTSGVMVEGAEIVWDHAIIEDTTIGNTTSSEGVVYAISTEFENYIEAAPWGFKMMPWKEPDGASEIMAREFTILAARTHYHILPRTCGVGFGITR